MQRVSGRWLGGFDTDARVLFFDSLLVSGSALALLLCGRSRPKSDGDRNRNDLNVSNCFLNLISCIRRLFLPLKGCDKAGLRKTNRNGPQASTARPPPDYQRRGWAGPLLGFNTAALGYDSAATAAMRALM